MRCWVKRDEDIAITLGLTIFSPNKRTSPSTIAFSQLPSLSHSNRFTTFTTHPHNAPRHLFLHARAPAPGRPTLERAPAHDRPDLHPSRRGRLLLPRARQHQGPVHGLGPVGREAHSGQRGRGGQGECECGGERGGVQRGGEEEEGEGG